MENFKDILMAAARDKGICAEGYSQMRLKDRGALIDYYVANPDWCMERGFPDLATLREEFADCEDKGVYVGRTFHGEVLNERQAYIFHNCSGTVKTGLNVKRAVIPMLYFANKCRMRIVGTGEEVARRDRPLVPLYIFGKNDVGARDNAYAIFTRTKHKLL